LSLVLAQLGSLLLLFGEECLRLLPTCAALLDAAEEDDDGGNGYKSEDTSDDTDLGALGKVVEAVPDSVGRLDLFEGFGFAPVFC